MQIIIEGRVTDFYQFTSFYYCLSLCKQSGDNIMAAAAEGTTVIKDAAELKVKESNRIDVMVEHLSAMGADITGTDDGMIITGGRPLHGAVIDSHNLSEHLSVWSFSADITGYSAYCSPAAPVTYWLTIRNIINSSLMAGIFT